MRGGIKLKKINRVIAMLLAIVMSFLCLSETVFAAEEKTAANERTSAMFAYFRNDRTTLDTSAVSPDELHVFGVFLSNFMIPGRTKLTEFFSENSLINETVAKIFFGETGSNNNSKTIANLTKMLGSAMLDEDGLQPLSIINADNDFETLTMKNLVQKLETEEKEEKKQCIYLGEEPIINITYTNFKLALAEALAVSLTDVGMIGKNSVNNTGNLISERVYGVLKWLSLYDDSNGNGQIVIDCIGNFWYKDEKDYTLFIPACLQAFVFEKKISTKIPLVNAFYMGCMIDLNSVKDNIKDFETYATILSKALKTEQKKNAITMCVLESSNLSESLLEATSANKTIESLSNANLINIGTQEKDVSLEKANLLINASWSNYFYDGIPDLGNNDISYLFDAILRAAHTNDPAINYNKDSVFKFLSNFCFSSLIPLEQCITEIYYFNTNGMKDSFSGNGDNWKTDSDKIQINDAMLKETLFNNNKQYNTVANSNFLNYLIAVNDILNNNELASKTNCEGVDWQYMATKKEYDNIVNKLVIPNCQVINLIENNENNENTSVKIGKPYLEVTNGESEKECCPFHQILHEYYKFNKNVLISQGCIQNSYASFKEYMNQNGNELLAPVIILYSITGNARLLDEAEYEGKDRQQELAKKLFYLYTGESSDGKDISLEFNIGGSTSNNDYLEDVLTSSYKLETVSEGNKNNVVLDFLYGLNIAGKDKICKAFGTFKTSNLATSFNIVEKGTSPEFIIVSPFSSNYMERVMYTTSFNGSFGTSNIFSTDSFKIGAWDFKRKKGELTNADGDNGFFEPSSAYLDNATNNAAFIGGLSMMLQNMYNYRIVSIRSNLSESLTSNSSYSYKDGKYEARGQFVANGCNIWPGIYWSYMVSMLNVRTENGAIKNDNYNNPCLPFMKVATTGGGLDLSAIVSGEMGSEPIEDMTMEQKQEDLINKALSILSTETSEYRDNWFKSMIDSWLISAHKSVIGTYMNSELSFNMGVETGSTTYASVTGYVSTPQLTDISITKTIIDNYGVLYIIMLVIVIIYTFALIIIGVKGVKEGILVAVVLAIVLVFPQVLLNNAIGIMNSLVDSMYSDRFNFWAIAKHQTSLNALAESKTYDEYVIASNIEMANQVYCTDQGVRIKWSSPKKIDNFKAIFSDAIENPNSSVNLTIFKTLFNSFFNQEQYTYDALETYLYRPYNAIANEAKGYYNNYLALIGKKDFENQLGNRLLDPFSIISKTLYTNSDTKVSPLYDALKYDNTTYSDNTDEDANYAKVDVSVALSCMLNNGLNELLGHNHEWGITQEELDIEKGINPEKITEDESLKLYYAYSESVFYYFYNVLKSEWNPILTDTQGSNKRLKDAMLEIDTFEKKFSNGSKSYIRDFLGLEYLFEYVIPYLNEGNIYVQSYIDKYGMDISRYDFTAGDKITIGTGDDAKKQEELEAYNKAKAKKEEYGQVWLMYSSWVDQLYTACGIEKVGKERFCTINAADYQTYLNRDMVFSELDMQGEYDNDLNIYTNRIDYTELSAVEQKIIKVLKNSYEDIMYLNNYWNYDEEVILTAAAMMATFNFNKEFSSYKILGESNVLYPQNFELQNFNYDAFLRLIIMNSTGENLTDTTDLYTRVIGKTSVFTGILLLLTDITAVIGIPALKLIILLIMLLIGLAICLTCMTMQIKEIPKKLWICILKPILLFALFTIAFAWVISLFVGTGLTSYVGSSSVSIVTNDPTITFLLLFLVNVVYIIGLVYLFIMLFKIAKKEIKGVALAVSGAVAGAVATSAGVNKIKDRIKRGTEKRRLKKLTDKISDPFKGINDNTNEAISKERKGIESEGHTNLDDTNTSHGRNKASSLMNDLNSGSEEEKKNNKALDDIDVGRHKTRGLSAEVSKTDTSKESIGSKAATKYTDIAMKAQTGINSVKGAWNKVKSGAFKVKSGVSRVGKAIVDEDTYKSLAYSAKNKVENIKDSVVDKATGIKDSIVDKATNIKDSVVDTARDAKEQFSAANDLLAERKAQLAENREKEYEKAINATIEVNQKKVFERKENAAKFDEAREEKRKRKEEVKNEKEVKKKEI